MQIVETAVFVTLKNLTIGAGIAYLSVLVIHFLKGLFFGKRKTGPHLAIGKIMTPLIALCFLGLSIAFILLLIGTHRMSSQIESMERDGEHFRIDFPQEQFYFGYLDLSDRFVRLRDLLKAKCDSVNELNNVQSKLLSSYRFGQEYVTVHSYSDAMLAKTSLSTKQSSSVSSRVSQQLNKISRVVFEMIGGCSEEEKEYLVKSDETNNQILYMQKRFYNTLHTVANKVGLLTGAQLVSAPLFICIMLYLVLKYRKDYVQMAEEECKSFGMILVRSHAAMVLFLIIIALMFFVLLQFVPLLNATINVEDVYERKIESKPKSAVNFFDKPKSKINFIKNQLHSFSHKFNLAIESGRLDITGTSGGVTDIGVTASEGELPSSQSLKDTVHNGLSLLGKIVDFQDEIDSLVVEINHGILKSDMRPLMRVQLNEFIGKMWNGVCLSAFIAIYIAYGALGLHIVQILLTF